jgi:dolichyl-phosphate-mannose--protein O-mannosyl transferase
VVIPIAVYTIPFAIHFALLTKSGNLDSAMSLPFQATLEGNPHYVKGATISFWAAFVDLHRTMQHYNLAWSDQYQRSASPWYTWPVAKHSIGLLMNDVNKNGARVMVIFGNQIVWWTLVFGLLVVAAGAVMRTEETTRQWRVLLFLGVAYVANYLPFAFITRPMYLYHYFFALIYSAMLVSLGVGALAGWDSTDEDRLWKFPSGASASLYFGVLGLAAVYFIYLAPLSYGRPLNAAASQHRARVLERKF